MTAINWTDVVAAQQAATDEACGYEGAPSWTTQVFLFQCGCLVFFLQAGFAMLEAGSIGSTSVTNVLFKNFCDSMVGAVVWFAVGYAFAFGDEGNQFIGSKGYFLMDVPTCDWAFWFYQWTFAATTTTIISGCMAGRTKLQTYIVYSIIMTGFVYPVVVHWTWSSDAWLWSGDVDDDADLVGYRDFAGSGIVHICGGVAGLVGAYMVGPRGTKLFENSEDKQDIEGHSMPLVALGTLILIFGFFGFNGGSVLEMDSVDDAMGMSRAVISTVMGASGGCLSASGLNKMSNKYWSLVQACNGALAGMVSVCASANVLEPWAAWVIGIVGGAVFRVVSHSVHKLKIDDAVDAAAVHFGGGLWGLIAGPLFANGPESSTISIFYDGGEKAWRVLGWNILGLVLIIAWTVGIMTPVFYLLNKMDMLRVEDAHIDAGLDKVEHGEWAYVVDSRHLLAYSMDGAPNLVPPRGMSPPQTPSKSSGSTGAKGIAPVAGMNKVSAL